MTVASDSGDWTRALFEGVPFSEVLRAAAHRAQARAAAEDAADRGEKASDTAPTWRARPKP